VADGSPVDWDQAQATAADDRARRRLRHLKLIAGIAEVHRTLPDDAPDEPGLETLSSKDGLRRWGHLVLLEKIGEGNFGDVYHAHDPWLDRDLALKLLRPATTTDVPTARIVREARALARVHHPNVVTVHGADVHDGRVGLWMELVRGQTLEGLLALQGPFGAAEAALIGQDLCNALAAVHAAGLVHRDVKTANVMRESGGRLVLMDFGSGQLSQAVAPGQGAGTPLYLAPEVLTGGRATPQSDIYALGVLLYRLVTAEYPIEAASVDELREAHERGERRSLYDARPDLPKGFVAVVERALDADPQRRYPSVGEMQTALSRTIGAAALVEPTEARPAWTRWGVLVAAATLVIALAASVVTWRWIRGDPGVPLQASLIAVLPFQNLSADPADAYLASAVPMELTLRLGQIGALKVVPWTFMNRFNGAGQPSLKDVAHRTGADVVIEGAVLRPPLAAQGSAHPVQIRVQVFQAGIGSILWSGSFERDMGDFFALQVEIAREVAGRIHVVLARREQILVSRVRNVSAEAMEDYLKARNLLEVHMDLQGAIELFQRAANRDPAFAEAHVGLSTCYALQSAYFGSVPTPVALQRAVDASNHAIGLDEAMPEAWAARAFARFALGWDWPGAESDFARAFEVGGPNAADVLDDYSNYLTVRGRHPESIAASRKAEERTPLSVSASRKVAWSYYMARQYDAAIQQLRRTLDIEPDYVPAHTLLGRAYLLKGMWADGIKELESAGTEYEEMLALGYAMAGRQSDANRLLDKMLSPSYKYPIAAYDLALVYAALGDKGQALDRLEAAYTEKNPAIVHLAVDPMLDPIRGEHRFRALLERLHLEQ
jgi:TolB-like protein/tetratricopeptide (TPR) repeat protein/RIO-like serine/threonine protein kinase